MMMDWEGGNEDDEETKEKLTKWRICDKTTFTTSSTIINANPTDLSLSSLHSRSSTSNNNTLSSSNNHHNNLQLQFLHHPFPITSSSSGGSLILPVLPGGSSNNKLGHVYVSTSINSSSSPSSSNSSSSSLSSIGSSGINSPCGTTLDLSTTTTTAIKIEPGLNLNTSSCSNSPSTGSGEGKTGTNNNNTSTTGRKSKPIPPPLDLSIGAANLSLNSPSLVTPTPSSLFQNQHNLLCYNTFCSSGGSITSSPFYWASSPKFNQAEKSLPLRKRWHSWSPIQMNCSDDPMLPLYTERGNNNGDNHCHGLQNGCLNQNGYANSNSRSNHPSTPNCNGNPNHQNGSIFNQSTGLQTPTPFYTPNEPSPKFMNSPVFSYSTPDTSLYQGPFSPIRSSTLYPPPSSPYMNSSSSLNTPTFTMTPNVPLSSTITTTTMTMSGGMNTNNNNSCFNMVPSTLLSPAPSQASTNSNSLSYEDLHEKSSSTSSSTSSLNLFTPAWNIFQSGTKVRFHGGMTHQDWFMVDFLAQNLDSMGLKEDYAPNGLQVRTLVVPCSMKEKIQITFCPIADPHHPTIEVNCESGHPFWVEKKGWCAVKPDAFFETYGTHCQTLEGGDVCLTLTAASAAAKSPQQNHQHGQQHQHQQPPSQQQIHNFNVQVCMVDQDNKYAPPTGTMSVNMTNGISPPNSLLPTVDEKTVPISVIPQHVQPQQSQHIIQINNPPMSQKKSSGTATITGTSGFGSGGKRANKDGHGQGEQKGRRPMNAFLLFAKDKRPELIQQYPGKDNRSISVLLGEAWQGLAPPEKEKYAVNARLRAEEQKRMHPDCWKRKRSQSQPAV